VQETRFPSVHDFFWVFAQPGQGRAWRRGARISSTPDGRRSCCTAEIFSPVPETVVVCARAESMWHGLHRQPLAIVSQCRIRVWPDVLDRPTVRRQVQRQTSCHRSPAVLRRHTRTLVVSLAAEMVRYGLGTPVSAPSEDCHADYHNQGRNGDRVRIRLANGRGFAQVTPRHRPANG
jgi:hypothetical protein